VADVEDLPALVVRPRSLTGVRISFSDDAQDFLSPGWQRAAEADPAATFFHMPRYLKLYWEELGHESDLLLAFAEEDGETNGAVAFERTGRRLRFLGGTEVTDYMGPVAIPGTEDRMGKELVESLLELEWTEADLRGLPEDSPWLGRIRAAMEEAGLTAEVAEDSVAPLLELPATYEEYLAALPGKLRHEIKRKARRLEVETGGYELTRSTAETLVADLDCFVALHRSSEGPKGKFMEPGMEIFFRRLGEEFVGDGTFRLTFLEIDGVKTAGAIGFSYRGTFFLYNSAYDREWSRLAPGLVLVGALVRRAIDDGCGRFDMLKGDLEYKYRFGATPRAVKRLVIRR
jgi:CelD/BcsL family acetyltransferase involved in cellulose biosynthesis